MDKLEKVISGLEAIVNDDWMWKKADYYAGICKDAIALLKAQEPPTVRECKDLQVLRDIKSGKVLKSGCKDYVIYNGDWYRTHKWDAPQEPIEPYRDDEGTYTCGACGKSVVGYANWNTMEVERLQKYCSECGQAVKWE